MNRQEEPHGSGETVRGRIIRGIGGFYYLDTGEQVYACRARGIFRKRGLKPLVGDYAEAEITDPADMEASISEILPRKNALIRPAAANVDQAVVFFAMHSPDPDTVLLDRFLILMERQHVPVVICFNKSDLGSEEEAARWRALYEPGGYEIRTLSAGTGGGVCGLREILKGKTTILAGPSGAGKSTLTNALQESVIMETGEISRKLGRGRHTTRRAELIRLDQDTWLCDTPGFTSLETPFMEKNELQDCFPEFAPYAGGCRFQGCAHMAEPGCRVKEALEQGHISPGRYRNYQLFYRELSDMEKRRY